MNLKELVKLGRPGLLELLASLEADAASQKRRRRTKTLLKIRFVRQALSVFPRPGVAPPIADVPPNVAPGIGVDLWREDTR